MRWKCKCAYDGTDFYGWQSQVGGNTIQDFIEGRLAVIFKQSVRIHGSGRTDSGVHAKGQVFHFDAQWDGTPKELLRAMRCGLPSGIQVYEVKKATNDFHARYSAKGKRYVYSFYRGYASPLDARYIWSLGERALNVEGMQLAASFLVGEHDFSAFGASRGHEDGENPVKDLRLLDLKTHGRSMRLVTEGSGYLYKMVRSLAGTLIEVGRGKITPEFVNVLLEGRARTERVVTAPAKGLCLDRVYY